MPLALYLTSSCNLNCRYCFSFEEKTNHLAFEDICKALDTFKEKGETHLTMTGGEPFLRKDILDIIDYAYKKGFWMTILSNGLLITDEIINAITEKKHKIRIRISLEGASKKTHEYFRGRDTYEPAIKTIKRLKNKYINVGIGFTAYEENVNEIKDIVNLCVSLNCSFLRIVPVVRLNKGKNANADLSLYQKALVNIAQSFFKYKKYIQIPNSTPDYPIEIFTSKKCIAGDKFFGIDPEKHILACPLIRKEESLIKKKFENGKDIKDVSEFMDSLFKNQELKGKCKICDMKELCLGGCLAEKLSFGFSLEDEQPFCVKDQIQILLNNFDAKEQKELKDYWFSKFYENKSDEIYCTRHLPMWSLDFK